MTGWSDGSIRRIWVPRPIVNKSHGEHHNKPLPIDIRIDRPPVVGGGSPDLYAVFLLWSPVGGSPGSQTMWGTAYVSRLAGRIASRSLDRSLDMMTRASVLEAIAGLPKGTWSSRPLRGLVLAEQRFPGIYDEWVTTNDTGMVAAIRGSALKHIGSEAMAEEVTQNILAGLTTTGGVFAHIGKQINPASLPNRDSFLKVRNLLARHARHRAGDAMTKGVRTEADPSNIVLGPGPDTTDDKPRQYEIAAPGSDAGFLGAILDGPGMARAFQLIRRIWEHDPRTRPSDLRVMDVWLKDPSASNTDIGHQLGISGSFVSAAIRRLTAIAAEGVKKDPRFRSVWMGLSEDEDSARFASSLSEALAFLEILGKV